MSKHEIIISWSDEDQAFIAEVPELLVCLAHGATKESALSNAKDAIDLWIQTAKTDCILRWIRRLAPLSGAATKRGMKFTPIEEPRTLVSGMKLAGRGCRAGFVRSCASGDAGGSDDGVAQ